MQVLPPLTQSQRGLYVWEQMKRGIGQWYECHKTAVIASLITALVIFVVLLVLTDGVLLEVLPEIMEVLGGIFIGISMVRMSMFIADYVARAVSGDVKGAAKSLARGVAIGVIELLMYLLTGGSGKGAAKAAEHGAEETASGAARAAKRTARPFSEAAADAGRRLLTNIKDPVGAFVRNGRVFIHGVEEGAVRGVRSLRELGERILQRLGFRGLSIQLHLPFLDIIAHFNADMVLVRISIRDALSAERDASAAARMLDRLSPAIRQGKSVAALAHGDLTAVARYGEQAARDLERFAGNPAVAGLLPGGTSTAAVVARTQEMAERIAARAGAGPEQMGDIMRNLGALSGVAEEDARRLASHAERQIAAAVPGTRSIGSAYNVCEYCQRWFLAFAKDRGAGLVIADPEPRVDLPRRRPVLRIPEGGGQTADEWCGIAGQDGRASAATRRRSLEPVDLLSHGRAAA